MYLKKFLNSKNMKGKTRSFFETLTNKSSMAMKIDGSRSNDGLFFLEIQDQKNKLPLYLRGKSIKVSQITSKNWK